MMQECAMNEREQFTIDIKCPNCGQSGSAAWEENAPHNRKNGVERKLVLLSNGFRQSDVVGQSGDSLIACDRCDATLAD
jgi:C4-type Zn-finger protein